MIKKITSIFLLCAFALFAARVKTGAISETISYTVGVADSTSTNVLIGYLPPKSSVNMINLIPQALFNAQTNCLMNVFAIYNTTITNVTQTVTNFFLINANVATNTAAVAVFASVTNGTLIASSNASVPVYANFSQSGKSTAGHYRVAVHYMQY